jgi:hypothetical protein
MAAAIPAAGETAGEVSRQQIGRDRETAKQLKLALAEVRGLFCSSHQHSERPARLYIVLFLNR